MTKATDDAKARLIQAAENYVEHAVAVAERRGTPMSRAEAEAMHKECFRLPAAIFVPDLEALEQVEDTSDLMMLDSKSIQDAKRATLADAEAHCALQLRESEIYAGEFCLSVLSLAQTQYALALAEQAGLPPTATLGEANEAGKALYGGVEPRAEISS